MGQPSFFKIGVKGVLKVWHTYFCTNTPNLKNEGWPTIAVTASILKMNEGGEGIKSEGWNFVCSDLILKVNFLGGEIE